MILKNESPDDYRTRPVRVRFDGESYCVEPFGDAYDFSTMRSRRQPLNASALPAPGEPFELELANLGVSTWLRLEIDGKNYLALVFHRRNRGDQVLKLVSGYVPTEYLDDPGKMILQEISEEVLLQTKKGFCRFALDDQKLPWPYLDLKPDPVSVLLQPEPPPFATCLQWFINNQAANACGYIDTRVSSLQLIYSFSAVLPETVLRASSAEDELVDGQLLTRFDPDCQLVFAALGKTDDLTGDFYCLADGKLQPVDCSNASLSEAFVPRQDVFVSQSSIKAGKLVSLPKL
ncbi:hypothetical protein [Spongorhabdus nitratireducens]